MITMLTPIVLIALKSSKGTLNPLDTSLLTRYNHFLHNKNKSDVPKNMPDDPKNKHDDPNKHSWQSYTNQLLLFSVL